MLICSLKCVSEHLFTFQLCALMPKISRENFAELSIPLRKKVSRTEQKKRRTDIAKYRLNQPWNLFSENQVPEKVVVNASELMSMSYLKCLIFNFTATVTVNGKVTVTVIVNVIGKVTVFLPSRS